MARIKNRKLKTVSFTPKSKSMEFSSVGSAPLSNCYISINDTDVTPFILPPDIIQVEFSANSNSVLGYSQISAWRTEFKNGERFFIQDSGLSGADKTISFGFLQDIKVDSLNLVSNIGIANAYVYIETPGRHPKYNTHTTQRVITSNTTFITSNEPGRSGNNKIIAYFPQSSLVNVATSNTIQLTGKVKNSQIANALNTGAIIYIVSGKGAGQNATISSYDSGNGIITISNVWDLVPGGLSNNQIFIDDRAMIKFGGNKADKQGRFRGKIIIPSIPISDEYEGAPNWQYYKRWNKFNFKFKLFGLNDIINIGNDDFSNTNVQIPIDHGRCGKPKPKPKRDPVSIGNDGTGGDKSISTTYSSTPFAQTFFVDASLHPQGIFLKSCKLLFHSKDSDLPIQVQIRPVTNGIPDPVLVVPNGDAFIDPANIPLLSQKQLKEIHSSGFTPFNYPIASPMAQVATKGYGNADDDDWPLDRPRPPLPPPEVITLPNSNYYGEAIFPKPVYLESGKEYAIVIITKSPKYKIYISQIGENVFGTNRKISTQPYLGVLFKTQGTSNWTPSPNEDLCFELVKYSYSKQPKVVNFYLKSLPNDMDNFGIQGKENFDFTAPLTTIPLHAFYVTNPELSIANTSVKYEYKTTRSDGVTQDEFKPLELSKTFEIYDSFGTRVLTPANNSFVIRATLQTFNTDISPIIDYSDLNMVRVAYMIDNNTIANSDFLITNQGSGYSNAQNVIVTISGGGGDGATAIANVVDGIVDAVTIVNPGSGYTESPTITISGDTTSTINAEAIIIGEDQTNGGIALSKYITRRFTLSKDFTAGDLRVIFSAVKPIESEIDVYYKIKSEDDADDFENKKWTLMTLIGGINDYSITPNSFKNYLYAPGKGNLPDNFVNYDGFTTFKQFAVKIVMRSTNESKVPIIKDLRIVSLAELLPS